jgi:hypothetical protein
MADKLIRMNYEVHTGAIMEPAWQSAHFLFQLNNSVFTRNRKSDLVGM